MRNLPHFVVFIVASTSLLAGAAIAILPAVVLALVKLFYNSVGGVLILLGSIINLVPHSSVTLGSSGAFDLPVFQMLTTNTTAIVIRSGAATLLCTSALTLLIAPERHQSRQTWLIAGLCSLFAALTGGRSVALVLMPALLVIGAEIVAGRAAAGR